MRNKITWTAVTILMIALCVCTLSACGQKEENSNPLPVPSLPIVSEEPEPEENNLLTDEEGLVQVSIENGSASISFDLARWDSLYGILQPSKAFSYQEGYMDPTNLSEGPFPISGLTGKVKDAVIAQMESLDWMGYPSFVTPAVILLMEDGSVEWLLADPYSAAVSAEMDSDYRPYTSYGRLPLIEKVHNLSYETEDEGRGDITVYAVTGDGLRYNLRILCNMMTLFDDVWTCVLRSPMEQYAPPLYGYMTFYEDGNILYDVIEGSYYTGYPYESWVGKYELILAEDQLYPPGTIVFDMELNWWVYEWDEESDCSNQQYTPHIKGTYRFDAYAGGTIDLFLNDGDDLYPYKEENPELYTFLFGDYVGWTDSFSNMTDEELVGWLTSQVPEAYEWIYTYGMTPLITGDYTQFTDGDVGRDIWLGTDSGGKFTREILYSIGMYGAIYEYDAVGDRWTLRRLR